jgi:hypothetical protein
MGQPGLKGGGPKDELTAQETQKQESKLESSLGSRGMSKDDMMGKPEIRGMIRGMKGSVGAAVKGFLGRMMGKK